MNGDKKAMRIAILQMKPSSTSGGRWAVGLLGVALAATVLSSGCGGKGEVAEASPTVTVQVGAA